MDKLKDSTELCYLCTLLKDFKSNWKDHLNKVIHAYNCTRIKSTGYSSYFLLYGHQPHLPIDIAFNAEFIVEVIVDMSQMHKWMNAMKEAYKIASQCSNTKQHFD